MNPTSEAPTGQGAVNELVLVVRSLLYVPLMVPRFIQKAHGRGADGIILDLEDSIALEKKAEARSRFADSAALLNEKGVDQLFVRINQALRLAIPDLEAVVSPLIRGLVLPKAESAEHVRMISAVVTELEEERGIRPGSILLAVRVETADAFFRLSEIASADPRVKVFGLGGEDFSLSIGIEPAADTLMQPKQMAVIAARAAGASPHGLIGSSAEFSDLDKLRAVVRQSRRFGFEGASCIHPAMVPILNEGFGIPAEEIELAIRISEAFDAALQAGSASIGFEGRMVDYPVAFRARRLLARQKAIQARESRSAALS